MISKVLEGVGGKLADVSVIGRLLPAVALFFTGLLAWLWQHGWPAAEDWLKIHGETERTLWLLGTLLAIVLSAVAVERLTLPVLRLLEGYWPRGLSPLRQWLVGWQQARLARLKKEWQALKGKAQRTPAEETRCQEVDLLRMQAPAQADQVMPTRLGNILRAAELRPRDKYGLDTLTCWPRLWLVMPEHARKELTEARQALDAAVRWFVWGLLLCVWVVWAWWAAVAGVVIALFAYQGALAAAEVYGTLLESAFDLYHVTLYDALQKKDGSTKDAERSVGERVSQYLYRGPGSTPLSLPQSDRPTADDKPHSR